MTEDILGQYLNGRLSAGEARTRISKASASDARRMLEIIELDQWMASNLRELVPPEGAAERLYERVSAPQLWARPEEEAKSRTPLLRRLRVRYDVVGHSKQTKKGKKKISRQKKKTK